MAHSLLTADVGGTNARFQLWLMEGDKITLTGRKTLQPSSYPSMLNAIKEFLSADFAKGIIPSQAVIAVCGPVWDNGRKNESNNIAAWCLPGMAVSYHEAADFERSRGVVCKHVDVTPALLNRNLNPNLKVTRSGRRVTTLCQRF